MGRISGFAQLPLIIGLLIMAVAIPVAARLAQMNQETRRSAAESYGSCGRTADCASKTGCKGTAGENLCA